MKITSVRKNTVCSSQVSTLTISIIIKVLFSSCAAKILHVWDTGMKEADGISTNIPRKQWNSRTREKYSSTSRAAGKAQHRSAHKKCWQERDRERISLPGKVKLLKNILYRVIKVLEVCLDNPGVKGQHEIQQRYPMFYPVRVTSP